MKQSIFLSLTNRNKQKFSKKSYVFLCFLLLLSLFLASFAPLGRTTKAAAPVILLSAYSVTMNIGEEVQLKAVTSDFSIPKFKSSKNAVASVDAYGRITAKKAGLCRIQVKSGTSEVYCQVQVKKTVITLKESKLSLECNASYTLKVSTSNGRKPSFSCNKKSIAIITESGRITALKPGNAVITVSADQTKVYCMLTVKKPTITLNHTSYTLYRNQTVKLSAVVSSGASPVWKTNKKSVAVVDETGLVTAVKHGVATISAVVNGEKKECKITVKSPTITLNKTILKIHAGKSEKLTAAVSSGNPPVWSSSKSSVATVKQDGTIIAKKKGTAVIKVKEDGTTASCTVLVE